MYLSSPSKTVGSSADTAASSTNTTGSSSTTTGSGTGQAPKLSVHTWELYDEAFAFPRVRRYDLVQQHMDLIQHFEDNLNQNMSNGQLVSNYIKVCKDAQAAFNAKYHDGEFSDPAGFDPQEEHKTTWSNVKF